MISIKKSVLVAAAALITVSCQTLHQPKKINAADAKLLDQVQKDVLQYFTTYAEPNSKLAPERYHVEGNYPQNDAHVITTGGSGFGMMTILAGVDRKFISRQKAVHQLNRMADFLATAERHHGAWSHWIDGKTGKTVPFGKKDDGGDLVETAFLVQGMITVREYFKNGNQQERALAAKMDALWKGVDWAWYTRGGENVLYWHWSPTYGWDMNFPLLGYDETLITYILAASSPTHTVPAEVYHEGWARSGKFLSNQVTYGWPLMVKHNGTEEFGGPLFWAQYSYLGLNPTGLSDQYVNNYFDLTHNHTRVNYQYVLENPKQFAGYGPDFWGLTAGYTRKDDGSVGYTAHRPGNDRGVINPTAALSSFPYTPVESMRFLEYLYNKKPQFIGPAGPYDAVSLQGGDWFTPRYLAIDQGTISPMIENYRSGLLWDLFMNAPEIRSGLKKLGFHSSEYKF